MSSAFCRLLVPALVLASAAGCKSCDKNKCSTCPPPPPPGAPIVVPPPAGAGAGTILPPAAPPPGAPVAPPPSFPTTPAGSGYPPVASYYGPDVHLGVPAFGGSTPNSAAQAPPQNKPADTTPRSPTPPADVKLLPPEFGSSTSPPPPGVKEERTEPKPSANGPAATPSLPVGIPDFAPAIPDRVAGGRKPALDGLDWLKANGYKSALLIRRPGENDTADRKQFEVRGLTFTSLEVSPATLTAKTVEEFAKLVSDASTQPLFVYDADGSLAGGLWYLYFRKVEKLSDEAARLRAARLGLKETDGPQREMWLAVQKVLGQI